ncbi:hypothetical protein CN514_02255 [Bacillus sp. AFS001701]|nr:hypothetical protein CN514_02255 [Bacillus sp. AFS001701]
MSSEYIQLDISLKGNKIYENSHYILHIYFMFKITEMYGGQTILQKYFYSCYNTSSFLPMKNRKRILKLKYDMIFKIIVLILKNGDKL